MACLFYGGTEWGGALSRAARMDFAEPDAEPNYGPSRTVVISHMDITLRIDPPNRRYEGRSNIAFQPLPDFNGRLNLDLDDVEVTSVCGQDGESLDWRHNGDVLEISVPEGQVTVVIEWVGGASGRGMYFTGPVAWAPERQEMAWTQCQDEDGHFVFPCHDHPRHKHTWAIRLEAPVGYTLLSNGEQLDEGETDGWVWRRFAQRDPMPAYLFTAVAARLSCLESEWRGRPVRYFVPEGEEEAVVRSMGKTPLMMEHFSQLLGIDYPWPRYDQVVVHDFVFGGMENTACTTMTDVLLVTDTAIEHWDPDGLVAHELAHQWFGDFVTCQDWSQGWLNESWATFMETQWWEHDRDRGEAVWYRYTQAKNYWAEESGRYRRPIVSYRFKEPIDVFDRHLYEKGSCVLSTLRFELGDKAFWAGVNHYLSTHGHDTVHTRHFQRAMEARSGRNLDRFFEQWVHSPGHPVVSVSMSRKDSLLLVNVKQTQNGEDVPEAYTFNLHLEIHLQSGECQSVVLPVDSRERVFALPCTEEIHTVRVDPAFRVLAKLSVSAPTAWLTALLHDECPVVSDRAAIALLRKDGPKPLKLVVDALHTHASPRVRSSLASQLGRRGGEHVRDELLKALGNERDPRVSVAIIAALKSYRTETVFEALSALLKDTGLTEPLYGAILTAIGHTRHPDAVKLIVKHLNTPSWADVIQGGALAGLGMTRDPAAFELLSRFTQTQYSAKVRASASTAIAHLAEHLVDLRDAAGDVLIEVLKTPGFREVLAAMNALGKLRDSRALDVLSYLHTSASDGRVRRGAYESMAIIRRGRKAEEGVETLRAELDKVAKENAKMRERLDRIEPFTS